MTSEQTCYVYIMLPGTTEFVTAARFQVKLTLNSKTLYISATG
jgi:hypothetical protein